MSTDDIADLERYLDATRAGLLYARRVLLVEGPAELFLLPALVQQILGVDLDELGISVIPIFGVHFDVYAKLFGPNAMHKRCAIVADGDLKPSDATVPTDGSELPTFHRPDLDALKNPFLNVFLCKTTFERAIALPANLGMFAETCRELGATKTERKLTALQKELAHTIDKKKDSEARDLVLAAAKSAGKARFAQVATRHISLASQVPPYIKNAIDWLKS